MKNIGGLLFLLALFGMAHCGWLASRMCNRNELFGYATIENGNCMASLHKGEEKFRLITCDENGSSASLFRCTDSRCKRCSKEESVQLETCTDTNYFHRCYPKTVDFAEVIGSPNYFMTSSYNATAPCTGEPEGIFLQPAEACVSPMPGLDEFVFIGCDGKVAQAGVYSDKECQTVPEISVFKLNECEKDNIMHNCHVQSN